MQVIYLDILFVLNFVMNFLTFFIGNLILNRHVTLKKMLLGSILATVFYCFTLCIPYLQKGSSLVYALCIPILPICYMFEPKKVNVFFKDWLVCNGCACIIGGVTFNIYYLCIQHRGKNTLSILLPIGVGLAIAAVVLFFFTWIRSRLIQPYFEYTLILKHEGKKLSIVGLLDTGNCLYTVLGHQPVIIADYGAIKPILGKEWISMIESCQKEGVLKALSEESYSKLHVQVIPFKSVGCKEGLLVGMVTEQIEIKRGEHSQQFKECVIGICHTPVFENENYEALLHPDFIRYS